VHAADARPKLLAVAYGVLTVSGCLLVVLPGGPSFAGHGGFIIQGAWR